MNVRLQTMVISHAVVLAAGIYCGYNYFMPQNDTGAAVVAEVEPAKYEVIKYVDQNDSTEVKNAPYSRIDIVRKYSPLADGIIYCTIDASNGYVKTTVKDQIKIQSTVKRNAVMLSYGLFVADRVIYNAPEVYYLRKFGLFNIGAGLTLNAWNAHQIYGVKIIGGYEF